MNNLIYRKATLDDLEGIRVLNIKAYSQFKDVLTPDNWEKLRHNMEDTDALRDTLSKSTTFICEAGGEMVGVISIMPKGNPTAIYPDDWAYIRRLGVSPEHRGLGIARQLMILCIDHAREQNEHILALHTSEMMAPARALYEALGFTIVRELDPIFGTKYWLYKLNLK